MSDENLSLLKIVDGLTGELLSSVLKKITKKISKNSAVIKIQNKLRNEKGELNKEISDLLRESIILANDKVKLGKDAIKITIYNKKNLMEILKWCIEENSDKFNPKNLDLLKESYESENDFILAKLFLEYFFEEIRKKRESYFNIPDMAILSEIKNIKEDTSLIKKSIPIGDKFKPELKQIEILLDERKLISARQGSIALKSKIEKEGTNKDKIVLNTHIANSYLLSQYEEESAIPFLENVISYSENNGKIYRNKAIVEFLKNNQKEANIYIDKAINEENSDESTIQWKFQILLRANKLDEALKFINSKGLELKSHTLNIAHIYYYKKDFEEAIKNINIYINVFPKDISAIRLKIIVLTDIIKKLKVTFKYNDDYIKKINELTENNKLFKELISTEDKDFLAFYYNVESLIAGILNKAEEQLEFSIKAFENDKRNPDIILNLILANLQRENYQKALILIEENSKILEKSLFINDLKLKVLVFVDPQKVVNEVEKKLDIINKSENYPYFVFYIEALISVSETSKAKIFLDKILNEQPENPIFLFCNVKYLYAVQKNLEAIEILNEIIDKLSNEYKMEALSLLGGLYGQIGKYNKIIELYKNLVNPYFLDDLLNKYARALFDDSKYKECLELCTNIRDYHGQKGEYVELEAMIHYNLENYRFAINYLSFLSVRKPDYILYKTRMAYCFYRLGDYNKAIDILMQVKTDNLTAQELCAISSTYKNIGKKNKTIELAYLALEKDQNDRDILGYYIFLFIFCYPNEDDIDQKYIKCFQKELENYKNKYPETIKDISIHEDPKKLFESIKNQLFIRNDYINSAEQIYSKSKLPLSFISKQTGIGLLYTWKYAINNKNLKILAESGNREIIKNELVIAENTKEIYIDLIALLTLDLLGLKESVLKVYEKIFICQSTLDYLNGEYQSKLFSMKNGSSFLALMGEKVVFNEEVKEDINKELAWLRKLLDFILNKKEKIIICGNHINRKDNSDDKKFIDGIDRIEMDVFLNANSAKIPALFAESFYRGLNYSYPNIKIFGLQFFLKLLLKKNETTEIYLNEIYLKLINKNYFYISINSNLLSFVLNKNNYILNKDVVNVFYYLAESIWDYETVLKVVTDFFKIIWNDITIPELKKKILYTLLDIISRKENKKEIQKYFLQKTGYIFSRHDILNKENYIKVIKNWCDSQFPITYAKY